jgi:hypothetical protein
MGASPSPVRFSFDIREYVYVPACTRGLGEGAGTGLKACFFYEEGGGV